jgi:putative ribosome biogenesis GTPase RsgA
MVLVNKTDLLSPGDRTIEKIISALSEIGVKSLAISALTGNGLEDLKAVLARKIFE